MNTSGRRKLPSYMDPRFSIILAVVAFFLAFISAVALWGDVRLVDLLILFFGGFGAGAGVTAAVVRHKFDVLTRRSPKASAEGQERPPYVRRGVRS